MSSATERPAPSTLDWLNPLRALAFLGIVHTHLTELVAPGAWFTNPSSRWAQDVSHLDHLWPDASGTLLPSPVVFLGWLGDEMPGVFIVLSGLALAWSSAGAAVDPGAFYRRRLARLYPPFVALHLVVFLGASVLGLAHAPINAPATLLSMLGIRPSEGLFFYINPSWWFVWLMVQLYLVFPWLNAGLRRFGPRAFFAATCGFTLLCRGYALYAPETLPMELYHALTGAFFGTRLVEFTLGMVAADWLRRRGSGGPTARQAFGLAVPLYGAGLACALTWTGAIVSNLLMSAGLTLFLFALWRRFIEPRARVARVVDWMGSVSYGAFLWHQLPMLLLATRLNDRPVAQFEALFVVAVLAFPGGWAVERGTEWARLRIDAWVRGGYGGAVSTLTSLVSLGVLGAQGLRPLDAPLVWWALTVAFGLLLWVEVRGRPGEHWAARGLRWTALVALLCRVFLFTPGFGKLLALALAFVIAALALVFTCAFKGRKGRAFALSFVLVATVAGASEWALGRYAPLESGDWGEAPALTPHPTRHYALKPAADVHLRYNAYDYHVRTNSLGLASPEIPDARPTQDTLRVLVLGDAFSMPEGVDTEQGYAARLEAALSSALAPRVVQVVNAGVTGYGPVEVRRTAAELLPRYTPDVVVMQTFIDDLGQVFAEAESRYARVGVGTAEPLVPYLPARRSQLGVRLDRARSAVLEHLTGRPSARRLGLSLLEYQTAGQNAFYSEERLESLRDAWRTVRDTTRAHGGELVVMFVPGAVAVSPPEALDYFPFGYDLTDTAEFDLDRPRRAQAETAVSLGLPFIDLTPALRAHTAQPVYFPDAWHWTVEGHVVAAAALGTWLETRFRR